MAPKKDAKGGGGAKDKGAKGAKGGSDADKGNFNSQAILTIEKLSAYQQICATLGFRCSR